MDFFAYINWISFSCISADNVMVEAGSQGWILFPVIRSEATLIGRMINYPSYSMLFPANTVQLECNTNTNTGKYISIKNLQKGLVI